jgi:UDP-glucose:(heptosyl)LPS alpha-1,3-glucosyltransferase
VHFAFGIVSLFAGGGLQRDCIEVARRVRAAGHSVTVFTSRIIGANPAEGLPVRLLPIRANTNHEWQQKFSDEFVRATGNDCDLRVGFDKLGGLDVLYCADQSIKARFAKKRWLRLLPRYRRLEGLEAECFAQGRQTKVLLLGHRQLQEYCREWGASDGRIVLLPPTATVSRRKPDYRHNGIRAAWRQQLGLAEGDWVWLSIGLQPRTKGFDRTIRALRQFSDARLIIVGLSNEHARASKLQRLARSLGVSDRVRFVGHREDIPEVMAAADLFVHPARYDTTATAVLEAVVNGLPVVTSSASGYATHVSAGAAGIVLEEPFHQRAFYSALEAARDSVRRAFWSRNGRDYGRKHDVYSGLTYAAELIIEAATEKPSVAMPEPRRRLA